MSPISHLHSKHLYCFFPFRLKKSLLTHVGSSSGSSIVYPGDYIFISSFNELGTSLHNSIGLKWTRGFGFFNFEQTLSLALLFQQIIEFSKSPFNELGTSLHNSPGIESTRVFGFFNFGKRISDKPLGGILDQNDHNA